ncbi:DUF2269 family protein [Pseudoalteromonas denitrificans]|uniref:Uncharacterized membrane protein n=1 Tax=Pseudoalteromonas denitrificans DSM 6059 TaxID=1123010 RepID=A0A1I1SY57_9GAMM|nr:DUF2269 domain-containing protein [Pseudoalteromonas denitrificans]SFD51346.1 Uncharacterized membrane protein [Pseudoalteromonas denitrificans DSM 6059]
MEYYLVLKLIHILAAVVVTGTGAGIAFFMFMANRSNNPQAIYITAKHVILGDWIFTTPAVFTQITTGIFLMNMQGYSFSAPWFYWVAGLFSFIGLCWLPVLRIQYKLRELAKASKDSHQVTPEFKSLMRIWTLLGIPAFAAILAIFWLMVFKPFPVA